MQRRLLRMLVLRLKIWSSRLRSRIQDYKVEGVQPIRKPNPKSKIKDQTKTLDLAEDYGWHLFNLVECLLLEESWHFQCKQKNSLIISFSPLTKSWILKWPNQIFFQKNRPKHYIDICHIFWFYSIPISRQLRATFHYLFFKSLFVYS